MLKTVDQTRSQSKSVAHPVFPGGVSRALTKVARELCHGCAMKGRSCRSSPSKSQKDYCSGNMLGGFRQLISTTYGMHTHTITHTLNIRIYIIYNYVHIIYVYIFIYIYIYTYIFLEYGETTSLSSISRG